MVLCWTGLIVTTRAKLNSLTLTNRFFLNVFLSLVVYYMEI